MRKFLALLAVAYVLVVMMSSGPKVAPPDIATELRIADDAIKAIAEIDFTMARLDSADRAGEMRGIRRQVASIGYEGIKLAILKLPKDGEQRSKLFAAEIQPRAWLGEERSK